MQITVEPSHACDTITGVILAGGLGKRMQQADKGLVLFKQQPLIHYALSALTPLVDTILINANRNIETYSQFGAPVIQDTRTGFDGPLAGVLTALHHAKTQYLLVMPCDCPLIQTHHLQRLFDALVNANAEVAVAFDGLRSQSVFLALKTQLINDLTAYLDAGERKVENWLQQRDTIKVDFSDQADIFININTVEQLQQLEQVLKHE